MPADINHTVGKTGLFKSGILNGADIGSMGSPASWVAVETLVQDISISNKKDIEISRKIFIFVFSMKSLSVMTRDPKFVHIVMISTSHTRCFRA